MNEARRKPTTGRQSPSLFDKWHGIFHMPSRIDEAGHTTAFDYPVAEHWGESRNVQFRRWDSNRQHIGPGRTRYQLSHPGSPRGSRNPGSSTGGDLLPTGGIVYKESPRHEKAITMGPNNITEKSFTISYMVRAYSI